MKSKRREAGLHPAIWTVILLACIGAIVVLTVGAFRRDFRPYARVTLTSDRAGLVMEPGAKVKLRGVQVGRVALIQPGDPVKLQLELYPEQLKFIPANVTAEITAPTAFGAKGVELLTPAHPSEKRLAAGAVVKSSNVTVEVNTVFQNLVAVLNQVDVPKLNAVLTALADGFRGKGEEIGEATTDLNQVLTAINPRSETIRADYRALKEFSDTYSAAAHNIVTVLDAASTTSGTITDNAKQLDSLLLSVSGLSRAGTNLIGPNKDNLVHGINLLESTTRLLMKYNPELTCTLVGGKNALDFGARNSSGGTNGYSEILDVALLLGKDAYRYPDNLPINDIKGGPGGEPGCGSLPDVAKNWPQRYLVTDSGWGTGVDVRPNPGIGFPGYVDYFPVTRGTPQPPSIRHPAGPAPGPIPYPGAPPYGAQLYAPDGTPLYPGLPPAPPPGRPREPGPPPAGSEPFVPSVPSGVQATCGILNQQCVPPPPPP
ncbi:MULTISPECIES: MCE family protein [Mycobacterium avium complex (MAC)]|jgi:phospholipid/cholesterol/gamma-HCH transport system substrate-binding protein|uniref:MCE family protein n=2 Tax=Mycobacterium avium complex (MAC) TaxID=120793 RepID=A0AAW5S6K4_MYCBC|nr:MULTISPECIES: MCE family protein [Mycobacterium avium complex (MAC)]ETA90162.1 MCE-family protein MCE3A [Mycobacterium avium 05-4293]ETB35601.1 MCE-family protein MCE3A [Mycobacterium avium subsp. hominissuis 10-5606]ETZ43844.1 mce related family protein [Mycobacterium avium MAV_061107_1842]MBZ4502943.1 MCE family protein [Mycobacterium avium subsp. hominissuis]MBZ4520493.1 MCE family protein [Mycobacterium avium subsp. hominissuis]